MNFGFWSDKMSFLFAQLDSSDFCLFMCVRSECDFLCASFCMCIYALKNKIIMIIILSKRSLFFLSSSTFMDRSSKKYRENLS